MFFFIFIIENGVVMVDEFKDGFVNDVDWVDYYNVYLNMVYNVVIDGVEVSGYFVWSFFDNFEWVEGYEK